MASPARSSLLRTKAWIGGKWRAALSENTFPVYNPANKELIAEVYTYHHEINYNGRSVQYLAGDIHLLKFHFVLRFLIWELRTWMWRFKMHTQIKSYGLPRQLRYCILCQPLNINLLATPILYELLFFNNYAGTFICSSEAQ